MKKFKFIILSLYLALAIGGTGYAYWNDSLAVNSTVTTGEVAVRFVNGQLGDLQFPDLKASKYVLNENSSIKIGNDDAIVTDDNVASINIPNIFPGSWFAYRLKAINSGTVPVKITDVNFGEYSGDQELLKYLTYEAGIGIDADGNGTIDFYDSFQGKLEDFGTDLNNILKSDSFKNIVISPEGGIYFYKPQERNLNADCIPEEADDSPENYIVVKFAENAPDCTQNKTLGFKLTMNFIQFNGN